MSAKPPTRILFLRPDTYGDLFLFEPVPRIVRHAWPQTEVAVLIRKPYQDAVPLFASDGVRWLTTTCNPYRESPGENPAALEDLRNAVCEFAPDCVVAACTEQTWLECAVATFLPEARQVSLGDGLTDVVLRAALDAVLPVDWAAIYQEKVAVEPESLEWEKNLHLASALLGSEAPRWWPIAHVPDTARASAARVLAEAGLAEGKFAVCAAAGIANVQIKSWPAEHYGEILAWLERERDIRALLIGHASEREHLEAVRAAARRGGANPALWVGQDGEMPVVAGLLEAARFYLGNDTGTLHLTAALGRPVMPIFGGGHWPRFQPVACHSLTVVQPLPCFGCAWECYFVDAPCVRTISPASVRQALEQFLRDGSEGQSIFEAEGLDAGARALIHTATPQLQFLREDRAKRGKQITELTSWLAVNEAKRAALGKQLEESALPVDQTQTEPCTKDEFAFTSDPITVPWIDAPVARRFDGTDPRWDRTKSGLNPDAAWIEEPEARADASPSHTENLQLQARSDRVRELANRTEMRRLARELSLVRRLLRFSSADPVLADFRQVRPIIVTGETDQFRRLRAALRAEKVIFHLDACEHHGTFLVISGWAFHRAPEWDGRTTIVTLLFRHDLTVHQAVASRVLRPDLAVHFAAQRPGLAGGIRGVDGAGFTCEISSDLLAAGMEWEIGLRLECESMVCEQFTGQRLRL